MTFIERWFRNSRAMLVMVIALTLAAACGLGILAILGPLKFLLIRGGAAVLFVVILTFGITFLEWLFKPLLTGREETP